jgi:hypothetical protein
MINNKALKRAPKWAKFAAMDSNGSWSWYAKKPREGINFWGSSLGDPIPVKFKNRRVSDWTQSVVKLSDLTDIDTGEANELNG